MCIVNHKRNSIVGSASIGTFLAIKMGLDCYLTKALRTPMLDPAVSFVSATAAAFVPLMVDSRKLKPALYVYTLYKYCF